MNVSDITEPSPSYGIGVEALVEIWIAREVQAREKKDYRLAGIIHYLRRELQEAAGLVVDPETLRPARRQAGRGHDKEDTDQ